MRLRRRQVTWGLSLAVLTLAFLWLWPQPPEGNFPLEFSEEERGQIRGAVRSDANRRALAALGGGRFRDAWQALSNARKQQIDLVGDQSAGKIWVHCVVIDPRVPGGKYLSARYIMGRQGGRWVIERML